MGFLEIALPLVKRGIYVFPVAPGAKHPLTPNGVKDASNNLKQIEAWGEQWPEANVGCAANGVCMLDDDRGDLAERIERETGKRIPRTMTVRTSIQQETGLSGLHYYLNSTTDTILLGNRKHAGVFDFQAENKYCVGPGSTHPSGAVYEIVDPRASIVEMPLWLTEWIEKNSDAPKSTKRNAKEYPPVDEDFDFDEFCAHYGLAVEDSGESGKWFFPCPYKGAWHTDGKGNLDKPASAIFFDGHTLGFHCFATSCGGCGRTIGQLINHLNETHEPYRDIWPEEPLDKILSGFDVESADIGLVVPDPAPGVLAEAAAGRSEAGEYRLWEKDGEHIVGIRLSDVKERPVDWLWKGRLPAGCGMIISGPPGTNKSMLSLALVACVTNGWDWPDGEKNMMGARDVLIAATEDDLETTIKPRLMAMGADMRRITAIKNVFTTNEAGEKISRELNVTADKTRLYQMLKANPNILMIVLDPLTGFFGDVDGNDNKKIRPMMQGIAKVCRLTRVAFVMLIHENKRSDANAVDRVLGAGAVSQVVRAGVRISKDSKNKPDGRLMSNIKSSLSRDNGGMRFSVKSKDVTAYDGQILEDIGYIEWGERHEMSADDVLDEERKARKEGSDDTKLNQAVKIFEEALIGGRRLHADVHALLDAAQISAETKRRARWKLGVKSSRTPPWYWWLPGDEELIPDAVEPTIGDTDVL